MADPRADTSVVGVAAEYASFAIDNSTITYESDQEGGSSHIGKAVTLSAASTIELAGDAEAVLGRLHHVEADNFATVQVKGGMELPGGDGATLTLGEPIVGDLDSGANPGFIRAHAAATTPTAAEVDEAARARGVIVDASDATAVQVIL